MRRSGLAGLLRVALVVGGSVLGSTPAFAGDPCPISLSFGAASPSWRNAAADLAALKHPTLRLGMTWRERPFGAEVTRVYPGTAAAAAGLQVGDHLVAVSGAPLAGRSVAAAFDAVELHVPVRLTIERAGVRSEVSLLRGTVDPLLWGLFDAAGAQECRTAEMLAPDAALLERVESAAFDASRAFRCTDAHRRLSGAAPPGTVLVVRGGTRILLVAPGSGSRCVSVAEADGAPPALLKSWLDELTRAYVADRHRHP